MVFNGQVRIFATLEEYRERQRQRRLETRLLRDYHNPLQDEAIYFKSLYRLVFLIT